jgi:3-phenylpropionate/trans-cinnamate dioxygenase ferredoxin subunit
MLHPVAQLSEIPAGTTRTVEVDGIGVLLCNVAGTIYAVEDLCTHDGGPLEGCELDGIKVMCPRHGALFDVTTGKALTLPAIVPLPTYPVTMNGDEISIEV